MQTPCSRELRLPRNMEVYLIHYVALNDNQYVEWFISQ